MILEHLECGLDSFRAGSASLEYGGPRLEGRQKAGAHVRFRIGRQIGTTGIAGATVYGDGPFR